MNAFEFKTTPHIVCSPGCLQQLTARLSQLHLKRILVVSDQGIVSAGLFDKLQQLISGAGLECYAYLDVLPDPSDSVIEAAVQLALESEADCVIGLGGGSSMDTAKLVALLAKSNEALSSVYGIEQATGPRLPLILIPTTAGTGSEVTPISIVTTGQTTKAGVVSQLLLPDLALLDAELTTGLPAHVTAATGIDAMVHAIEAYTSAIKKNFYSDLLAKGALELLSKNIGEACHNGSNLEARHNMLLGACLAGQAFANAPVGGVHALAYPLGGIYHIPHGLSNALVLPHVMRFNLSHAAKAYAELAPIIFPDIDTAQSAGALAEELIGRIEQLIRELGLPTTLSSQGIALDAIEQLAQDAMLQTRLLGNNPRPILYEDALSIYTAAY